MRNERITEGIVRDKLRALKYYDTDDLYVEEQKSQIEEVKTLLKSASKTGKGGIGSPEFIISSPTVPDFLIVFECKPDVKFHESADRGNPRDYAVDGVIHYAAKLSASYNVIAIAVSGQTESSLLTSSFLYPKKSPEYKDLITKHGQSVKEIISFDDYIEHGTFDPTVTKQRFEDLMLFSKDLHNFMYNHAKLTEGEKPLLVSGTLIALRNKPFAKSFHEYKPSDLQEAWLLNIKKEIENADIPQAKKYSMTQPYSSIAVHPELGKATTEYPKGILYELIKMLNDKVWPFISVYHDFDVVGQFYGEFLKYTGGDKKALGIVLTPRHITELFTQIANVQWNSKVLDICCGTGGFLISSMNAMMKQTISDKQKHHIKEHCLVGVEQQPNMFALVSSNMILRGDGKANLYQGSCFDKAIQTALKAHKCNIGMINPPYSQSDAGLHELVFVRDMLNCLDTQQESYGIAIVPMSCAISPHPVRNELLKHHTLEAVMSMPDELFYPVGVVTCIMVFRAHIPHKVSNKKTWFGYWKNDGFIKTKLYGRIDAKDHWNSIRNHWISAFRNRDDIPGDCVKKQVGYNDEWCAEAYMETDYSEVTKEDFEETVKNYMLFVLNSGIE